MIEASAQAHIEAHPEGELTPDTPEGSDDAR